MQPQPGGFGSAGIPVARNGFPKPAPTPTPAPAPSSKPGAIPVAKTIHKAPPPVRPVNTAPTSTVTQTSANAVGSNCRAPSCLAKQQAAQATKLAQVQSAALPVRSPVKPPPQLTQVVGTAKTSIPVARSSVTPNPTPPTVRRTTVTPVVAAAPVNVGDEKYPPKGAPAVRLPVRRTTVTLSESTPVLEATPSETTPLEATPSNDTDNSTVMSRALRSFRAAVTKEAPIPIPLTDEADTPSVYVPQVGALSSAASGVPFDMPVPIPKTVDFKSAVVAAITKCADPTHITDEDVQIIVDKVAQEVDQFSAYDCMPLVSSAAHQVQAVSDSRSTKWVGKFRRTVMNLVVRGFVQVLYQGTSMPPLVKAFCSCYLPLLWQLGTVQEDGLMKESKWTAAKQWSANRLLRLERVLADKAAREAPNPDNTPLSA